MRFIYKYLKLFVFFSILLSVSLFQAGCLKGQGGGEAGIPNAEETGGLGPVSMGTPDRPSLTESMPPVETLYICLPETNPKPKGGCEVVCSLDQSRDPQNQCNWVECSFQEAQKSTEGCDWVTWQGGTMEEYKTFEASKTKNNSLCQNLPNADNSQKYYEAFFALDPCCHQINGKTLWGECPSFFYLHGQYPSPGEWLASFNDNPEETCPLLPSGEKEEKLYPPKGNIACCNDDSGQTQWYWCRYRLPTQNTSPEEPEVPEQKFKQFLVWLNDPDKGEEACPLDANGDRVRRHYLAQDQWACCWDGDGQVIWKACPTAIQITP